jgi:hypothetical protein
LLISQEPFKLKKKSAQIWKADDFRGNGEVFFWIKMATAFDRQQRYLKRKMAQLKSFLTLTPDEQDSLDCNDHHGGPACHGS